MPPYDNNVFNLRPCLSFGPPNAGSHLKSDAQIAQELDAAQAEQNAALRTADLRATQQRRAEQRVDAAKRKVEALRREQASRRSLKDALDKIKRLQEEVARESKQEALKAKLSGTLLIEAYPSKIHYVVKNVVLDGATETRFYAEYRPVSHLAKGNAWAYGLFDNVRIIEKLCA